jgi:hypothetical protein
VNRKKPKKEAAKMRKGMITLICIVGMILWGVTTASAQSTVVWQMLEGNSIAGVDPGADLVFGNAGDGTDNCNFLPDTSPCNTGSPTVGAYSLNKVDFKPDPREECYSGLVSGGTPCKCNDGATTCHPGADTCPAIPGQCGDTPGDCCGFLPCNTCVDAISYFGASSGNPGTLTTTIGGGGGVVVTDFNVGTSELILNSGGGCLGLYTPGDDGGAACPSRTAATSVPGVLDVDVHVGGCSLPSSGIFQVDNVNYQGYIFPVNTPPTSVCGYSGTTLSNLRADAIAAAGTSTGLFVMVLCGTTTLPATGGISSLPCYSNAAVNFNMVGWTTDTWTCP